MVKATPTWIARYQSFFVPLAILLGGVSIAIAIVITGGLGGGTDLSPTDSGTTGEVQVAVDDDPGLGDPNAPVTIVEFLSYECPFCQSFHAETLPQLKSQYIDTGKVRFVIRDFPLNFQDPAATKDALAANCARDQGGDEKYFLYHDEIFTRTLTEGQGLPAGGYEEAAAKLGLDMATFNSCLSTEKFKEEVAKDLADVEALVQDNPAVFSQGIGTPTFIIGKTDESGTFTGQVLAGAYPFENFQQLIEALLE